MTGQKIIKRAASVLLLGSLVFGSCRTDICGADTGVWMISENTQGSQGETDLLTEAESERVTECPQVQTEAVTEQMTVPDTEMETETGPDTETESTKEEETQENMAEPESTEPESSGEGGTAVEESETETETAPYFGEEEWTEEETETEYMEDIEEADVEASLASADLPPSGKTVVGASGWTAASMASGFSPDFYSVRFYKGISGMEVFNNSNKVVLANYKGRPTFYPTKGGQGGKFGVIYRNVLYNGSRWYDLKITVTNYTTSVRSDGGAMQESYPYIGFTPRSIGWKFNAVLGAVVMKCEFLDSATGAVSALNTRFQWWDVDGAQRFGLLPIDGKISGRYYNAGGSTVYYKKNVNIAGVAGMETVIGQRENASATDPAYCVAYELAGCSSYYMGIGERDHIDNDSNSYTKAQLEKANEALAAGTYSGTVEELNQTDTSLNKIRTPAPQKSVSNDGTAWAQQNRLPSVNGAYWYQIRQFVPWQNTNAYYTSFTIKDVLPAGVDYTGSMKIIREEDGTDVTSWFTVSEDKNVLVVTANSAARESAEFYGYHYCLHFSVRMNAEQLEPVYGANRVEYSVKNKAETIVKHSMDSGYLTEGSNTVTTLAGMERKESAAPQKGFDEKREEALKVLKMEDETITYSIFQDIPEYDTVFLPIKIEFSDKLEECLQFEDAEVKLKKAGSRQWETIKGWERNISGQNVGLCGAYDAQYNGGTLMFNITCRIRKNCDLSPWQILEEGIWTCIPNKAAVTFAWEKGEPLRVTKESNVATVKLREIHIRLSKEIDTADIVWAHGNPVFTFKVEGTDINGGGHTYYQTQEFTPANAGTGEKAVLTADFIVPAGSYTASEEKTMRYRLEKIHDIAGGTAVDGAVQFDLTKEQDGAAVFYNVKVTDEEESHTAFVKNHIGE